MNEDGSLRAGAQHPQVGAVILRTVRHWKPNDTFRLQIDDETMQKMYQTMVRLQCMDQIFYDAQRQVRTADMSEEIDGMNNEAKRKWSYMTVLCRVEFLSI